MDKLVLGVSVEDGYVELSIVDEDGGPIVIQIDGPTARAFGDLLFKAGCEIPPAPQLEA